MGNAGGLAGVQLNQNPVAPGALPDVSGVNLIGASDSAAQQYQAGLQSALTALQQRASTPNWSAVGAGFASAPAGSCFFRELAGADQALGQWQEQSRQMQIPIANLKVQMAVNRLAQNKAQTVQAFLSDPDVAARMLHDPVYAARADAKIAQMGSGYATPADVQNAAQSGGTNAATMVGTTANSATAATNAADRAAQFGLTAASKALKNSANTVSGAVPAAVPPTGAAAGTPPTGAVAAMTHPTGAAAGTPPTGAATGTLPLGQTPVGAPQSPSSALIPFGVAVHSMTQMESGNVLNPPANPASSATGSGQMISATLISVAKQLGVDPALYGKDPSVTAQMNSTLFTDNAQYLSSHHVPNTMLWNRMGWLLGAPAAAKAAHNQTSAPLSTIVSPAAMHANNWQPDMTIGDLLSQESARVQKTGVNPNGMVDLSGNAVGTATPSAAQTSNSPTAAQPSNSPTAAPPNLAQLAQNPNVDPGVLSQAFPRDHTTPFTSTLNLSQIPQATLNALALSGVAFPRKFGVDPAAATVSQTNAANTIAAYNVFNQQGGLSAMTPNLTSFLTSAANPAFAAKVNQVVGAVNKIGGGLQGVVRSLQGLNAKGIHLDPQQLAAKYGVDRNNADVFNEAVLALAQSNLLEAKMRTIGGGNTRPMADVGTADLPTINTNPREMIATMARTYNNAERYTTLYSAYQRTAPALANIHGYQNLAYAATFLSSKLAAGINHFYDQENSAYDTAGSTASPGTGANTTAAAVAPKRPQQSISHPTARRPSGIPWLNP